MSNDRDDARGRPQADPSGTWGAQHPAQQPGGADGGRPPGVGPDADDPYRGPAHGATAAGAATDRQQPSWSGPAQDGPAWVPPPQPGQQPYGQQLGAPQYGAPQYGAPQYGQPAYGHQPYGQAQPYAQPSPYGPYGSPSALGRPGTVVTAVVLGLVYGSLGLLAALLFVLGGTLADDFLDAVQDADPTLEGSLDPSEVGVFRGVFVALGLVALAWTVVMVWGSFLALRGRSRVLLLVGGWITVAATGFVLLTGGITAVAAPGGGGAAGVVFLLLVFLGAVAVPVLLLLRPSTAWFAAHRRQRALTPR